MSKPRDNLSPPWEDHINAYLDEELSAADITALEMAARSKPELARDLAAAHQLKSLLASMPTEPAPRRLHRKLLAVANPSPGLSPGHWGWLRSGAVIAGLALVFVLANPGEHDQPSEAEIRVAQQEFAIALSYLGRASQRTNTRINSTLSSAMLLPITENTLEPLSQQLDE